MAQMKDTARVYHGVDVTETNMLMSRLSLEFNCPVNSGVPFSLGSMGAAVLLFVLLAGIKPVALRLRIHTERRLRPH